MPYGWGLKAGMVRVWIAGKTLLHMGAISERFRDKGLIYKALYKYICLLYFFCSPILTNTEITMMVFYLFLFREVGKLWSRIVYNIMQFIESTRERGQRRPPLR